MLDKEYREANDRIHTPPVLLEETIRKARIASEEAWQNAETARTAPRFGSRSRMYRVFGACAACLLVAALTVQQLCVFTPVAALDERPALISDDKIVLPGAQPEAAMTMAACSAQVGADVDGLFPGFAFVEATSEKALPDAAGNAPEAVVVQFANDAHAIKLTVLLAPREVALPGGPVRVAKIDKTEVSFAKYETVGLYYALWQRGERTYLAESDTLARAQFIRTVKAAVRQIER